jgi:hypothetical protein
MSQVQTVAAFFVAAVFVLFTGAFFFEALAKDSGSSSELEG